MVSFEGGKFQYSGLGKIRPFMAFDKLLRGAGLVLAIGLFVISFWLLAFGNSGESIAGMILIVPSSFFIALSIRTNRYDKMVRSLVDNEH